MWTGIRRCHRFLLSGVVLVVTLLGTLGGGAGIAQAARSPVVLSAWVSSVFNTTARLQGQVNPDGLATTYHFDYIAQAAYDANLAGGKDPFSGAARVPLSLDPGIGSGSA